MAGSEKSPIRRVRPKNPTRKKEYYEKHHTLRLQTDIWELWQASKATGGFKTHDDLAIALLNAWESSVTKEVSKEESAVLHVKTPEKLDEPSTSAEVAMSTPLIQQKRTLPTFEGIYDISEGSESNGEVLERYLTKAKEADRSFIEISLDFHDEDRKDESYMPDSEEESDYEDLTEFDDFDLEMSLVLQDDQNFEILEIQGSLERESFIESKSDISDSEEETDEEMGEDRNLVKEKKVICFENNIVELAKMSPIFKCTVCGQGHLVHQWLSQPTVKRRLAGDFLLSTAILTSGNNYDKIKLLFRFFGMGITPRTTHYQIQGKHCVPVITEMFKEMIEGNRQKYSGQEIVVAGDGRMDSPGHSAQYCTYTLLEYQSKDIVAMEIIDKRMTGLKSTSMEKEGLKRAMASVIEKGTTVGELVTDASTTIAAWLRKDFPEVSHSFDTWHGAKNFGKRIGTVAAEKKNKDLRPWASDLINHFWFCSKTADGDESKLLIFIQHHKDRPKLVSKRGEVRLRRVWSKRSARWAAYEEKEPKQYSYLPSLHERILGHYTASDEPLTTKMAMSPSDPRRIKRTLADVSPPPTKQLFSEKKSRFEPAKL